MSGSSWNDPALPELLAAALERLDRGLDPDLDDLCADRPDLREPLERSLRTGRKLPELQASPGALERLEGRVLADRYRLAERLGSGAMGVVLRADDRELGRPVAIKVLRSQFLDDLEGERRFRREAEVLAAVRHPSVVTVHDRGRTGDDEPYLVMELLEGRSLGQLLTAARELGRGPTDESTDWLGEELGAPWSGEPSWLRTCVRWMAEVASGLAAVHQAGVLHRDVKPSNVLVGPTGRAVLIDFGIAALAGGETWTRPSGPLGTPAYLAPELLLPAARPTPACDVYGVGATLYHLLTLRAPYAGTPSQVLAAVSTQEPERATRLRPGLPVDLQAILDRAMAREPRERYASVGDLERDLRAFLEYRPVTARPIPRTTLLWRRLRRSPVFRGSAVAAGVLVLGVALGQVRAARAAHRADRSLELERHLAPNLAVLMPANRPFTEAQDPGAYAALLDELVDLGEAPVVARVGRALFRLDHGDGAGAARDARALAERLGTPLARALADQFEARAGAAGPAFEVDLEALPEPEGADDVYLRALFVRRQASDGDLDEFARLLADPRVAEHLPSLELGYELRVGDPVAMEELARTLEQRRGVRTAISAQVLGLALVLQRDYARAHDVLVEAQALAPSSHVIAQNACIAAWRSGRVDAALLHADHEIHLKPDYPEGYVRKAKVLIDDLRLDAAEALLADPIFDRDADTRGRRGVLLGDLGTERALVALEAGDREAAVAHASRARERYAKAGLVDRERPPARVEMALAVLAGEDRPVFRATLRLLRVDPTDARLTTILLGCIPEHLEPDELDLLSQYLDVLRDQLPTAGS